jgi:hypothetical protein
MYVNRIEREKVTVNRMINLYCSKVHKHKNGLCEDCSRLASYTEFRTDKCRFGTEKPVCNECPVHCYNPEMRKKIREVMQNAGPRMMFSHPYLAFMHVIDKNRFKKVKTNE